jgi:hypothetical protein
MATLPPPPPPPPPPPIFSVTAVNIGSSSVKAGESVTISCTITNTGLTGGDYTVILKLNNVEEARKVITLGPSGMQVLGFEVKRTTAGTYAVDINGKLAGTFNVQSEASPVPQPTPAPAAPAAPAPVQPVPFNWLIIGAIVLIVVIGLVTGLLLVKRSRR